VASPLDFPDFGRGQQLATGLIHHMPRLDSSDRNLLTQIDQQPVLTT